MPNGLGLVQLFTIFTFDVCATGVEFNEEIRPSRFGREVAHLWTPVRRLVAISFLRFQSLLTFSKLGRDDPGRRAVRFLGVEASHARWREKVLLAGESRPYRPRSTISI